MLRVERARVRAFWGAFLRNDLAAKTNKHNLNTNLYVLKKSYLHYDQSFFFFLLFFGSSVHLNLLIQSLHMSFTHGEMQIRFTHERF